jgi:hypothetical protein
MTFVSKIPATGRKSIVSMRRAGEKLAYIACVLNVPGRAVRHKCARAGLTTTWGGSPYRWPKGSLRYTGENAGVVTRSSG